MRARRLLYGIVLTVVLALGLAACGSSSSDDHTAAATAPSEAPTSTGATSGSGSKQQTVAKAQALLSKYEVRPTSLSEELPPVGKPIPSGEKIVYIGCGIPNCVLVGEVVEQADQILGWQTQILETNGTPTQIQNAWTQALREEPDGIIFGATDRSLIQRYLTEAEQRGIPVAAAATNEPDGSPAIGNGIDFNVGSEDENEEVFAAFLTANTNAGDGTGLLVSIEGLPTFENETGEMEEDLAKMCPSCPLDILKIPEEQFVNAPTLVVSYLRSHPDVKAMVLAADDILGAGLPTALASAGLSDVPFMGSGGNSTTLQYVETGREWGTVAAPLPELSYGMVDYLARRAAGVKPIPAMPRLSWLLTKGHVPDVNGGFPVVADVEAQYAKAWGK